MQNVSEPLANLKSFLGVAGEMILDLISKNLSAIKNMRIDGKTVKIRGMEANTTLDKIAGGKSGEEVMSVKPFTNLEVDIIPGTAYSDMQLKQDLITLREAGVAIPDEILLDAFKL